MLTYPDSLDRMMQPPPRRRWWRYVGRHLPGLSILALTALLVTIVLWPYVVINVPSGQVGVLWKRFNGVDIYCWCWVGRGTVLDPRELREEGLHLVWPWDKLFLYDLRLQSTSQVYNAISKDGVSVTAQISVRYQLLHNSVGVLHKFIGPGYLGTVVGPEIGSQARQVISQYTAQEVYTSREAIQKQIRDNAQKSLGANLNQLVQPEAMEQPDPKHYNEFLQDAIQILDTLVLSIELPPDIVAAINRQTEQYYMIQEFKFRVAREAEESKRKQIEADGIAAFQRTVSQGISDSYLRWRGIEATLALAQSNNAKIVVIGTGRDGLPIILGNVDTPPAAPGTTPPSGTAGATPPSGAAGATPPSGAAGTTPPSGAAGATPPSGGPGAPPAPGDKTPPGAPSTPPGATPSGDGSTSAPPQRGSSNSAPSGDQDKNVASSRALDLSDVQSIVSRISGALRLTGSDTSAGPAAKPKQ